MALPDIFAGGIVAQAHDAPQISLVKLVALLREQVVGSVTGSGAISRSPAGANVLAVSQVVKASSGILYTALVYNDNAASRWLQLHDANTLPLNGAVPLAVVEVPSGTTASFDFGSRGMPFTNGLVLALSTADVTLTATATADGLFVATYT